MKDEDFDTDHYEEKFFTGNDEDFDEDLYEETIHKVVYKRSSIPRSQYSRKEDFDEFSRKGSFGKFSRKGRYDDKQDTFQKNKYSSRDHDRNVMREQTGRYGRDPHDRPSRSWSQRTGEQDEGHIKKSKSDERKTYYSVAKWQVDYNNKNYIRSKLNKHGGFHRYAWGKPLDWDIEYDNMYYLRSFVNAPKGMHRIKQDIKRKLVPDNDILADSTGWEFEYGPLFHQDEGDVPFMPEERRVSRGAYRYYGVRRNPSDCDGHIIDKHLDLEDLDLDLEELKYGPEFLQEDVTHIVEQRDKLFGRGAYRYYDADRSVYDARPADPFGIEYRESYATLGKYSDDELTEDEKDARKGKPFKHTIFKKIITLRSPPPLEDMRYTHLRFIPGEGSRSFYEGNSLRKGSKKTKKHQRSGVGSQAFTYDKSSRTGTQSKNDFSSFSKQSRRQKENKGSGYSESVREYNQRDNYEKEPSEKSSLYQMRKQDIINFKNTSKSERKPDVDFGGETTNKDQVLKKFPSHIEERINTIKKNISEVEGVKDENTRTAQKRHTNMDGQLDFKKHSSHPNDHGKSEKNKLERYINKNGSEIWVKTEESYNELHHKGNQDNKQDLEK